MAHAVYGVLAAPAGRASPATLTGGDGMDHPPTGPKDKGGNPTGLFTVKATEAVKILETQPRGTSQTLPPARHRTTSVM